MKDKNIVQLELKDDFDKSIYSSVIESLLFVSGEPLKVKEIANIIECTVDFTKSLMKDLMDSYESQGHRGIKIININDEYQFVTKSENSSYIEKLLRINTRQSLSQASLETLAIIAYKQPVTRVTIDEIRGVKSDRAILTLLDKNLIKDAGRLDVIGRPILYATTSEFIKYFGLDNIESLPPLEELLTKMESNDLELIEEKEDKE